MVLAELWHWTGDKQLIRPLIDPRAEGPAVEGRNWADLDGDGFYEYLTRSTQGVKNQGWKDSGDAIVYADGSQVEPPIATCEEQAFVYVAKLRMAEMLWWLDRKDEARQIYHQEKRAEEALQRGFLGGRAEGLFRYGPGLKEAPDYPPSLRGPGHCVACGIVDDDLVRATADRLLADDYVQRLGSAHAVGETSGVQSLQLPPRNGVAS